MKWQNVNILVVRVRFTVRIRITSPLDTVCQRIAMIRMANRVSGWKMDRSFICKPCGNEMTPHEDLGDGKFRCVRCGNVIEIEWLKEKVRRKRVRKAASARRLRQEK